jgi:hypothetical protein
METNLSKLMNGLLTACLVSGSILSAPVLAEQSDKLSVIAKSKAVSKLVTESVTGEAAKTQTLQKQAASKDNNAQLAVERSRKYLDVSEPSSNQQAQEKLLTREQRQAALNTKALADNAKSHEFSLYAASVDLIVDLDYDGYYSEFTLAFDADTEFDYAYVFADLYLSKDGGPWQLYYTTDVFEINGYSGSDTYSVNTILASGFPPGNYELLIDLYDDYDGSLVATLDGYDEYRLADLPLEDVSYEYSVSSSSDFSVFDAHISLLEDQDNDGFYQSFSLSFDADVAVGTALVYAEVWLRDATGQWQLDFVTNEFEIQGYSTLDTYIVESTLESGYATGYYDFRVDIIEAATFELVASTDDINVDLANVPLEDQINDVSSSSGNSNNQVVVAASSGSGGGGSSSLLLLMLLATAFGARYAFRG